MVGDTTDEVDVLTDHDLLHDFCADEVVASYESAFNILEGNMLASKFLLAVLAGLHFCLLVK